MEGFQIKVTLKWLLAIVYLMLLSNSVHAVDLEQIVIVKSSDNEFYNKSIETLVSSIDGVSSYKIVEVGELSSVRKLIQQAGILINLGINAIESNHPINSKQQVINAYITAEQILNANLQSNSNQTNIYLDQPVDRYIALSQFLLNPKHIGLLKSSTLTLDNKTRSLLESKSTEFFQYHPESRTQLLPTLRILLEKNDLLLLLPDRLIINRDTLKGILLTTYRKLKPVISYSPAHVKSGALASVYASPVDIGMHIAEVINQLRSISAPIPGTYQPARYYSIILNDHVAHALGIPLPDINSIRKYIDEASP
jgi:putative tryptophan/tyrosine transport system substrate-binding protein